MPDNIIPIGEKKKEKQYKVTAEWTDRPTTEYVCSYVGTSADNSEIVILLGDDSMEMPLAMLNSRETSAIIIEEIK